MYNTIINYSSAELSSGTIVAKTLPVRVLSAVNDTNPTATLLPIAVKIFNTSGGDIHVGVFTDAEYAYWNADHTRSDLMPIFVKYTEVLNDFRGVITTVVVSGTVGTSYTSGVTFNFINQ